MVQMKLQLGLVLQELVFETMLSCYQRGCYCLRAAMDDGVAVGDLDGLAAKHLDGTADGKLSGADDGTSDGILYGHCTQLCAGTVLDVTENTARLLQFSGFISG